MKRLLLAFALVVALVTGAVAQDEPAGDFDHWFGLGAGFVSGNGLAYRYWPDGLGFQLTTAPLVSKSGAYVSLGAMGLFLISEYRWSRFFGYAGLSGLYATGIGALGFSTNVGGGVGMELYLFDHFALDLLVGYRGFVGGNTGIDDYGTSISVEGGIFYRL